MRKAKAGNTIKVSVRCVFRPEYYSRILITPGNLDAYRALMNKLEKRRSIGQNGKWLGKLIFEYDEQGAKKRVVLECSYKWYAFYFGEEDAHGFFIKKIDRKKLWNKPGELIFEVNPKK